MTNSTGFILPIDKYIFIIYYFNKERLLFFKGFIMQIKKDEVKNALLLAARQEFLDKGFDKSSIRNIVKNARTTIGNFYNYFESKEMVFLELTQPAYDGLIDFINNHKETEIVSQPIEQLDIKFLRNYLKEIVKNMLSMFDESFLLLIEYSENTQLSNAKGELIDFIALHFLEHVEAYSPNYELLQMGRLLSGQLIHGIIEIIKEYKDITMRETLITEQILFTSLGMMGILQGGRND